MTTATTTIRRHRNHTANCLPPRTSTVITQHQTSVQQQHRKRIKEVLCHTICSSSSRGCCRGSSYSRNSGNLRCPIPSMETVPTRRRRRLTTGCLTVFIVANFIPIFTIRNLTAIASTRKRFEETPFKCQSVIFPGKIVFQASQDRKLASAVANLIPRRRVSRSSSKIGYPFRIARIPAA